MNINCLLPVVEHDRAEKQEHEGQGAQQHHQPGRALNLRQVGLQSNKIHQVCCGHV